MSGFNTVIILLLSSLMLSAELVNPESAVSWIVGHTVGVNGGIPTNRTNLIDVTLSPYNADKTGVADCESAIQSAINAASSNDVVYLPTGIYRLNSGIEIPPTKDGITLRGDGTNTVIMSYVTVGDHTLKIGGDTDYLWSFPAVAVTDGLTKGSSNLTVSSTANFTVGQIVHIRTLNDYSKPILHVNSYQNQRRSKYILKNKDATTLTIWPPLYYTLESELSPTISVATAQSDTVGIEDIKFDLSNSTVAYGIYLRQANSCWIKNVRTYFAKAFHVYIADSINCEMRECYLDELNHVGNNGAGLMMDTSSACLVEDNVIYKCFPHIEINFGSCGNVVAYNFLERNYQEGFGMTCSLDINHGAHNSHNLIEGNIASQLQSDGYYGSVSDIVMYRNWFHGTSADTALNSKCVDLCKFTRDCFVIGNILGHTNNIYTYLAATNAYTSYSTKYIYRLGFPNMGNGVYTGYAPPWSGFTRDDGITLTQTGSNIVSSSPLFVAGDVNGFIVYDSSAARVTILSVTDPTHATASASRTETDATFTIWKPGVSGFQELDMGVLSSTTLKGNYNYSTLSIPEAESLGVETLLDSLYLTAKPDWFGGLTWPPVDPTHPELVSLVTPIIPAQARYLGVEYMKTNPVITWTGTTNATYPATLTASATATWGEEEVAGEFTFDPADGASLNSGTQVVTITFDPTDTNTYNSVSTTASVIVAQGDPEFSVTQLVSTLTHPATFSTNYFTPSSVQDAAFTYSRSEGSSLSIGNNSVLITCSATDTNYFSTNITFTISVTGVIGGKAHATFGSTNTPTGSLIWR